MQSVLLVEDEDVVRSAVAEYLTEMGFEVQESTTMRAAEEAFRKAAPDAVVTDLFLPDGNALDLIPRLTFVDSSVPFVIVTGRGSIDLAVRAMQQGAEHFLTKPVDLKVLVSVLNRALDHRRAMRREEAKNRSSSPALDPFVGTSEAITTLAEMAARVAQTDRPVLLEGETGSGKGVLARWLHGHGPRSAEPFVDINCAGLSRELLESELFGHEKGAFTGAVTGKKGLFEVGHRGSVFLDEIGDVDAAIQAKLLKVVEDRLFRKLGSVEDRQVDIRFIGATHRGLRELVEEGSFRSDLYYRLSTIKLRIPPLRERREDIPLLATRILSRSASEIGRPNVTFSEEALRSLSAHSWPGNIRELKNVIERAVLFGRDGTIGPGDLTLEKAPVRISSTEGVESLVEVEKTHIRQVIELEDWNVARAAERLDIPRSTLYKKIKDYDLRKSESSPDPENFVPDLDGDESSL